MTTMLFWDDQRLFRRSKLKRVYGKPELIADSVYTDPKNSISGGFPSVVKNPEGGYTMFYQAFTPEHYTYAFAAVSQDGIHWEPRNTAAEHLDNPDYPNQMIPYDDSELACVCYDPHGAPEARYKALVSKYLREELSVDDQIFVSPNGLDWTLTEEKWSDRNTEPGAGCVYSDVLKRFITVGRSGWGMRRLCVRETEDWKTFTPSREAIQVDSMDEPQLETYGMPVFEYKGWYVGLLWLYHVPEENRTHYMEGTMDCQLCYSINGANWQRSLRTPFIGNDAPQTRGMVFPSAAHADENGDIIITASATPKEHGHFAEKGGCIVSYRLREDGFIALEAGDEEGSLCTRDLLLRNGEITWNIEAEQATVAVYGSAGSALENGGKPIEGFSHEDCIPFSGDSTAWIPTYKDGRTIASLGECPVYLEICLKNGRVYAYQGDFTPMMNTEVMRYLKFGCI